MEKMESLKNDDKKGRKGKEEENKGKENEKSKRGEMEKTTTNERNR